MTTERNPRQDRDLSREKDQRQNPATKQERNPSQQRDQKSNQDHQSHDKSSTSRQSQNR